MYHKGHKHIQKQFLSTWQIIFVQVYMTNDMPIYDKKAATAKCTSEQAVVRLQQEQAINRSVD